jgi:hypothetical protein
VHQNSPYSGPDLASRPRAGAAAREPRWGAEGHAQQNRVRTETLKNCHSLLQAAAQARDRARPSKCWES